jgi:glycosyltransferase involved in cell wall biosynthesis
VVSQSLVVSQNYLAYEADIVLHRPGQSFFMRELKRLWAIATLLPRYEIIHYNAGTTVASAYALEFHVRDGLPGVWRQVYAAYLRLLQRIELAYVRFLGKVVFVTYQGDDARQGDYSLQHFPVSIARQVSPGYYCIASDRFKRRSIAVMDGLASEIYSVNPDLLHVLPRRAHFMPYGHIFLEEWVPSYTQAHLGPLRIVHAPSHRKVKGTDMILAALHHLKAQGHSFELSLVEGLSNAEARKIYESSDVLIDQLFAGWYGGLAVELMALGKPVLVYIRDEDLQFIPDEMKIDLPFLQVTPDTVEDALRKVLEMSRSDLVALGKKSRAFVERWHDPLGVAAAVKADYERVWQQAKKDKK